MSAKETINIIFLDDEQRNIELFIKSVNRFNELNTEKEVTYTTVKNLDELREKISVSGFDIAILDLKIENDLDAGNKVLPIITEGLLRIPVFFVTGHPENISSNPLIVNTRSRDTGSYTDDLNLAFKIHNTGLTHITKSTGKLNKIIFDSLINSIFPSIQNWIEHSEQDNLITQNSILRVINNNIGKKLSDEGLSLPEEFFLHLEETDRANKKSLRTGYLVKIEGLEQIHLVISPECDLVVRQNESCNTDHLILVEFDEFKNSVDIFFPKINNHSTNEAKKRHIKEKIPNYIKNNASDNYHYMPSSVHFEAGCLNFRKIKSLNEQEVEEKITILPIMVSQPFMKDISSRFARYYARQGQPNIQTSASNLDRIINQLVSDT